MSKPPSWLFVRCGTAFFTVAAALTFSCSRNESAPATASRGEVVAAKPAVNLPPVPDERVEVTSAGFKPARIDLGSTRRLVFRRVSDNTCATEVVFPSLGIQKPLPLDTDVDLELPASASGELTFQCGMGMHRGQVVAR